MSDCESLCDCDRVAYAEHAPDCHSRRTCDEGHMCDRHCAESMAEHRYLQGLPRWAVIDDEQSREEQAQELRAAGRGHLVRHM